MEDCLFCKIATGEIPSLRIYEDDNILAFMDIKPVTNGHCLVIPKNHAENIFDIPETDLHHVIDATKKICANVKKSLSANGILLSQSNGSHAGQAVFHFHLHIIPRYENDGVGMSETATSSPPQADFEELKKLAEKIKM